MMSTLTIPSRLSDRGPVPTEEDLETGRYVKCDCGQLTHWVEILTCEQVVGGKPCRKQTCPECNLDDNAWELLCCPEHVPTAIKALQAERKKYSDTLSRIYVQSGEKWARHEAQEALQGSR